MVNKQSIASYIDHTILKAEATTAEIEQLCNEAIQYRFASVCINPTHVLQASKILSPHKIPVCTVIGFPLGANTTFTKVREAEDALSNGATEIDMVINVGALKDRDYSKLGNDIASIVNTVGSRGLVKVIIECALLTDEEKIIVTEIIKEKGGHFVKTSTGMNKAGGATVHDVALLKRVANGKIKVKAAGGIRTYDDAIAMITAGADRIGASASISIVS